MSPITVVRASAMTRSSGPAARRRCASRPPVGVLGVLALGVAASAHAQSKPGSLREVRTRPTINETVAPFLTQAPLVGTTREGQRMVLDFAGTDVGKPFTKTGAPAPCAGLGDDCMAGVIRIQPMEWYAFQRGNNSQPWGSGFWLCLVFDGGPTYRCHAARGGLSMTIPERYNVLELDGVRFVSVAPTSYVDEQDLLLERLRATGDSASVASLRAHASATRLLRPMTVREVLSRAMALKVRSGGLTLGLWQELAPDSRRTLRFWRSRVGLESRSVESMVLVRDTVVDSESGVMTIDEGGRWESTSQETRRWFWWHLVVPPVDTVDGLVEIPFIWLCRIFADSTVPIAQLSYSPNPNPQAAEPFVGVTQLVDPQRFEPRDFDPRKHQLSRPPVDTDAVECAAVALTGVMSNGEWYRTFSLEDGSQFVTLEQVYHSENALTTAMGQIERADAVADAEDSVNALVASRASVKAAFDSAYRPIISELHGVVQGITVRCDPRTDPKNLCRLRWQELLRAILSLGSASSETYWRTDLARVTDLAAAIPEVRSSTTVQGLLEKLRAADYPDP